MTTEYRVYGPPGCGKTTYIAERTAELAERFGEDQVSICSLTNSAVREAVGRDLPLDPENVSTLHARCKRSLQAGPPAEASLGEFLEGHPQFDSEGTFPKPMLQKHSPTRGEGETIDEVMVGGSRDLTLFERMQILRQQQADESQYRADVGLRAFRDAWFDWMAQTERLDFTGWLETALRNGSLPPQQVVFVDEAQDHTPLQLDVIRGWQTKHRVLVGDDDQNLYEWSGAIPDRFFLPPIPEDRERVLWQSYRVPRAVHEAATSWVKNLSRRKEKIYHPRDEDGEVQIGTYSLTDARDGLLPRRMNLDPSGTHMFLASAGYMIDPIIKALREQGIPYHNPYRRSNAKWNPMGVVGPILDVFLKPSWTWKEAFTWLRVLRSTGVFQRGRRKALLSWLEDERPREVFLEDLKPYLLPETLQKIDAEDVRLFELRRKGLSGSWPYAIDLYLNRPRPEDREPKVTVGTIHSVKGGQADHVYLMPDLSFGASREYFDRLLVDRVIRLMYVGMTRAARTLVLGAKSERYAVDWNLRGGH